MNDLLIQTLENLGGLVLAIVFMILAAAFATGVFLALTHGPWAQNFEIEQ